MRQTIRIYDNGGRSADRYTAIDMSRRELVTRQYSSTWMYCAIAFNSEPFHPQGFGQHVHSQPGRHLGKRIELDQLPAEARRFVEQFEKETTLQAPDIPMDKRMAAKLGTTMFRGRK